jgi:hypothetical protein
MPRGVGPAPSCLVRGDALFAYDTAMRSPDQPIATPPPLDCVDGIALYRPSGSVSLAKAVALVEAAIVEARRRGCRGLLVQITALSGFGPPSIAARHEMIRRWAIAADGRLRVALVIHAEFFDPERFGEVSAANFGLAGKGFLTEAEALAWLRAPG